MAFLDEIKLKPRVEPTDAERLLNIKLYVRQRLDALASYYNDHSTPQGEKENYDWMVSCDDILNLAGDSYSVTQALLKEQVRAPHSQCANCYMDEWVVLGKVLDQDDKEFEKVICWNCNMPFGWKPEEELRDPMKKDS